MVHLPTLATLAAAIVGVHSYYAAPCPGDRCAKSATPYCSSYLGVPKRTRTSTYTSTAIITKYTSTKNVYGKPTTITTTVTVPKTEKTITTVTSSTSTQKTVTVTPTCKAPVAPLGVNIGDRRKRQNYGYDHPYGQPAKPTKPACLSSYKEHADVTKACKCLSIQPSTTIVKTTITQTSTVKRCKEITKAPTVTSTTTIEKGKTTKTETTTVTSTSTLDPMTVSAPVAIPTNFNLVYSDSTDTIGANYYANVDITALQKRIIVEDQSEPIIFSLPTSETATVFSLDDDNGLLAPRDTGAFNPVARLPGGSTDPQKLTYGPDGTVAVSCTITANADDTCSLQCTNSLNYDTEYSCGHTGIFELGSGSSTTESDSGEVCTAFTPFVVDVGDVLVTVPVTGSDPISDPTDGVIPEMNITQ